MNTDTNHTHRHPDGSIDFDRYRAESNALRRQAQQDGSKLSAALKVVAAIAVTLAAIAVAPAAKHTGHACQGCAADDAATSIPRPPQQAVWGRPRGQSQWRTAHDEPSVY